MLRGKTNTTVIPEICAIKKADCHKDSFSEIDYKENGCGFL